MAAGIPPVPANFKQLQHYIKTAAEHDSRDPVVAYYCNYSLHHYAMMKHHTSHSVANAGLLVELLKLQDTCVIGFLIIVPRQKHIFLVKHTFWPNYDILLYGC